MVGDSSSSDLIWQMLAAVESAEMTAGLGSRASAAAYVEKEGDIA
jgi:hypothetical protein